MITIKDKQIQGLSSILDCGSLSSENAKELNLREGSIFIVMNKLGPSLKDVLFDNEMRIQ